MKIPCISFRLLALGAAAALACSNAFAQQKPLPFVSPLFGDGMVIQRGKPIRVWGWAPPGEKIRVQIAGQNVTATAGPNGRWEATLAPLSSGSPETLRISGSRTVELHNVVGGDVWLCGGQSNMELPLQRARNGDEEARKAEHPSIRFFKVQSQPAYGPTQTVQGGWKICTPQTVLENGGLSAAAYYFALKIQSQTNVPIGLLQDCLGGTPAEAWTSATALRKLSDFDDDLAEVQRLHKTGGPEYGNYIMHWYDEYDVGLKGASWASPDLEDSDWKRVTLPGGFKELGVPDTPSLCYFRKTLDLPDPLPPGPATLRLGVIERMDTTQINGHWVGASAWVENPRVYRINDGILKPGRNVLTVRVLKLKPDGGFMSPPDQLRLVLGDKTEIPLAGEWKGKLSVDARPPHALPRGFENWPVMPSVLYQGMIAPLAPLSLTGAIWYQGEANAAHAFQYRKLLPAMIADWRRTFGQGDFPFGIVSLPAFEARRPNPGDDPWAELREAQALTAKTVPNCGLAVTIDTGDANDIHPKDKREVGDRLGLWALANHYHRPQAASGPSFASFAALPGRLKIHFTNAPGGLVSKGAKPGEFSVAGEDRKWFWADARIEGDDVLLSCPSVPHPVAARYAWQANPVATLFNSAGLPATPFRTDSWPGITESAREQGK